MKKRNRNIQIGTPRPCDHCGLLHASRETAKECAIKHRIGPVRSEDQVDLNTKLRWKLDSYKDDEKGDYAQIKHALLHIVKAVGGIANAVEPLDHITAALPMNHQNRLAKFLADTVICCMRIAQLCGIDLEAKVMERLIEKMEKE